MGGEGKQREARGQGFIKFQKGSDALACVLVGQSGRGVDMLERQLGEERSG